MRRKTGNAWLCSVKTRKTIAKSEIVSRMSEVFAGSPDVRNQAPVASINKSGNRVRFETGMLLLTLIRSLRAFENATMNKQSDE
jgi:hypothetical protein